MVFLNEIFFKQENLNANSQMFLPKCAAVSFRLTYKNAWKIGTGSAVLPLMVIDALFEA